MIEIGIKDLLSKLTIDSIPSGESLKEKLKGIPSNDEMRQMVRAEDEDEMVLHANSDGRGLVEFGDEIADFVTKRMKEKNAGHPDLDHARLCMGCVGSSLLNAAVKLAVDYLKDPNSVPKTAALSIFYMAQNLKSISAEIGIDEKAFLEEAEEERRSVM